MSILNIDSGTVNEQLKNEGDELGTTGISGSDNPAKAGLNSHNLGNTYGVNAMPYINMARVLQMKIGKDNKDWTTYINSNSRTSKFVSVFNKLNQNLVLIPDMKDDAQFLEVNTHAERFFGTTSGQQVLGFADKLTKVYKVANSVGAGIDEFTNGGAADNRSLSQKLIDTGASVAESLANKFTFTSTYDAPVTDKNPEISYPIGSFKCNFYAGQIGLYDAYEEVVKPILGLLWCFLPQGEGNIMSPVYPTSANAAIAIIKGLASESSDAAKAASKAYSNADTTVGGAADAIKSVISNILSATSSSMIGLVEDSDAPYVTFKLGHQNFYKVGISKATASFNANLTDDRGWPTQGSISLEFIPSINYGATGNVLLASKQSDAKNYITINS